MSRVPLSAEARASTCDEREDAAADAESMPLYAAGIPESSAIPLWYAAMFADKPHHRPTALEASAAICARRDEYSSSGVPLEEWNRVYKNAAVTVRGPELAARKEGDKQ